MEFLLYLGKFLLFTLLSELLRPKINPSRAASAGLKDINFPTVDPTRPHQWLIGRRLIDNANLFATYDFNAVERSRKVRTGLISSQDIPLPTEYYISAAMTLCGGSGVLLKEIWIEDVKVWTGSIADGNNVSIDYSIADGGSEDNQVGFKGVVEFHSGSTTPSAYLVAKRGAGNVPSWKHLTYVVLRGATAGAWIGTSTTVKHIKFVCERMPTATTTSLGAPADAGSYWAVDGDANPAYAIAEVLTDRHYGAGIGAEQLDPASFHATAKALSLELHGTSQLWDSQRASGDVVLEICRQIGAILQPDPLTGLQTLRLLRAVDVPVFTLNDDNIQRLSQFSRSAMDEATNAMQLQYTARDEKYEQRPVEVQDLAAIEIAGQVISGTASYAGITNATLGGILAMRDLRTVSAPLAIARLSAIVPQRQKFMPGDAVLFSSPKNGISSLRMRVTSARYSSPGQAVCELELVEDVFLSGEAVYGSPGPIPGSTSDGALPTGAPGYTYYSMAPRGLSGYLADHLIYAMSAGDVSQTAAYLGWSAVDSPSMPSAGLAYATDGPTYPLAVSATLSSALEWTATGLVAVTMDAANMATLTNLLTKVNSGVTAVLPGEEFVQVSHAVISSPTSALLTIAGRGLYDTYPRRWAAGSRIVLLTGLAVDPAPLATTVDAEGGTFQRTASGLQFSRLISRFKNVNGVGADIYGIGVPSNTVSHSYIARSMRPVVPGAVQFDGQVGARYTGETLPVVSRAGRTTVRLSWVNRGYGEDGSSWFNPTPGNPDGLKTVYVVWTKTSEASPDWTQRYSARVDATTQFLDVASTYLASGSVLKVSVHQVEQIDAAQDIWPLVNSGNERYAYSSAAVHQFSWKVVA